MQQILFKSEFSVLFDAAKTKNVQYLEEKVQPLKRLLSKKIQKKKSFKIVILRNPEPKKNRFKMLLLHIKFGINRTSRLVVSLYTDRFTDKLFVLL